MSESLRRSWTSVHKKTAALLSPLLCAVTFGVLTACAPVEKGPLPGAVDIPKKTVPHLFAAAAPINIVMEAPSETDRPHIAHLYPETPATALATWVDRNLAAMGGEGKMRVVIEESEVISEQIDTEDGVRGRLNDEPDTRLTARLTARLVYSGPTYSGSAKAEARAERTLLESAGPEVRDAAYYLLLSDLVLAFAESLEPELPKAFGPIYKNRWSD